jgi:hypothetical protein
MRFETASTSHTGSRPDHPGHRASDDIYEQMGTIIALLERQKTILYNIGLNAVPTDFRQRQNP